MRLWITLTFTAVCICALAGCGNSGASDAGDPYRCVSSSGTWTCPGNAPSPQCPASAANPINPGDPCSYDGGCFYCDRESVGIECACNSNGDGGSAWQCLGAGYSCTP